MSVSRRIRSIPIAPPAVRPTLRQRHSSAAPGSLGARTDRRLIRRPVAASARAGRARRAHAGAGNRGAAGPR